MRNQVIKSQRHKGTKSRISSVVFSVPLCLCLLCASSVSALEITNSPASGILTNSAWLNASVISTNGTTNAVTATVYSGLTDGGTNTWSTTNSYGSVTNLGAISNQVTGLSPANLYYFRWSITEGSNTAWSASSSSFETLSQLAISAAAVSNIAATSARFYGTITVTNGSTNAFNVKLLYGATDYSNNAALWSYTNTFAVTVTNVPTTFSTNITALAGTSKYYCRWYATEGTNGVWSSSTTNFWTLAGVPTGTPAVASYHPVMVNSNGVVVSPTNLLDANDVMKESVYVTGFGAGNSNKVDRAIYADQWSHLTGPDVLGDIGQVLASLDGFGAMTWRTLGSAATNNTGDFLATADVLTHHVVGAHSAQAIGPLASAAGWYSVAIGNSPNAAGSSGVAVGSESSAAGASAVAVGYQANASGQATVAIGYPAHAVGQYSTSIGYQSIVTGNNSVALGYLAVVPGGLTDTTEIGRGTATTDGWFHYRGIPVIDSLGKVMGSSISGTVAVASYLSDPSSNYFRNANNLTNWPCSYTPFIIPFSASNDIALANGNYQWYAPTGATTIYLPASATNQGHNFRLDINPGTNSFTLCTNNLIYTTNETIGVGSSSLVIRTNATTSLIFDKAYNSVNWRVFGL